MSDAELFDRYIREKGYGNGEMKWPSHIESTWTRLTQAANQCIQIVRSTYERLPEIYFGFVDNPRLNAMAFKAQESNGAPWRYFIGVFAGTRSIFYTAFSYMLRDRRFFPNKGDISKESGQRFSLKGFTLDAEKDAAAGIIPQLPNCPIRGLYCMGLLEIVFRFLVMHEIAHILNGHLDIDDEEMGSTFLLEHADEAEMTNEQKKFCQALEVDADAFATRNVIFNARSPWTDQQSDEIAGQLRTHAFAMFSFFRIFGDAPVFGREFDDHPPDRTRHALSVYWSRNEINSWGFENAKLTEALIESVRGAEVLFSAIMEDENLSISGYQQAEGPEGSAYALGLVEYLNKTVKPLLRNAFHDLYKQDSVT